MPLGYECLIINNNYPKIRKYNKKFFVRTKTKLQATKKKLIT